MKNVVKYFCISIIFFSFPLKGQSIISSSKFALTDVLDSNIQFNPRICSFKYDSLNKSLKLFSVFDLFGKVLDSKKKISKNKITFYSGSDNIIYDSEAINISKVELSEDLLLKNITSQNISKIKLNRNENYEFEYIKKKTPIGLLENKRLKLDYEDFVLENKDFVDFLQVNSKVSLTTDTDRANELKDVIYPIREITTKDPKDYEKVKYFQEPLNIEEWREKFKEYDPIIKINTNNELPNGSYIQGFTKYDAKLGIWDRYYNFEFINYDINGKFVKSFKYPSDYAREVAYALKVFSTKGLYVGIVYIFSTPMSVINSKKYDPVENRSHYIFFDENGNVKIQGDITVERKINPRFAILENEEICIYNKTSILSLSKKEYEILKIDKKGKVEIKKYNPYILMPGFKNWELKLETPMFFEGKIFDVYYDYETQISSDKRKIYYSYTGAHLFEFNTDLNLVSSNIIVNQKPSTKPIKHYNLIYKGEQYVIFTYKYGNSIISLKNPKNILKVFSEKMFVPGKLDKNFVFNEKTGILYFVYESVETAKGSVTTVKL
jgi:hypothetical protein